MSIFLKTCPECASTLPNGDPRCPCGYDFVGANKPQNQATLKQIVRQEQLYEDYLYARAEQAARAAQVAAEAAARAPGDTSKAEAAYIGRREADAAYAQLMSQRARSARFAKLAARADPARRLGGLREAG